MRTIKNDVTKNEANKEILKLRKQIDYWKEQVRPLAPLSWKPVCDGSVLPACLRLPFQVRSCSILLTTLAYMHCSMACLLQ